MKKILEKLLAVSARSILKKYRPKIVGITGSIGKTSAKEAVFAVLNTKFNARQNLKNYNNEIGLPLSIIGAESGGKSPIRWLSVFSKALGLIFGNDKDYPEILVLEMGADKPGDIEYLINIAPCDIGVVTRIGPTHIEFFGSIENIAREKRKIVSRLAKTGTAVLNYDDPLVKAMHKNTKAKVIFFGYNEPAEVRSVDLTSQGHGLDLAGLTFKISYGGSAVPVTLPNVIGKHQTNAALIAAAVGIAFDMNLIEISEGLKNYKSPKGRMNLVPGMKGGLIVDDTYNSSPQAAQAALESVAALNIAEANRKIAILGDMLELGELTEQAHYDLGKRTAESGFDMLVGVGKYKEHVERGALEHGLSNIFKFNDSDEAAIELKKLIQAKDLILIKGSQGVRMEKIVKALMREPDRAEELLVRQEREWQS